MVDQEGNRLGSWTRFLNAVSGLMSKLVWSVIGIILIATLGRFLYFKSQDAVSNNPQEITAERVERRAEVSVPKPIPWHEVDKEIVSTLKKSAEAAEVYAAPAIEELIADLQQRINDDFLNWYFAYWQQQWMGLKGIGYWIMDRGVVEKVIGEQPDMAERITEDIQEEFAKRVLRPQILQLRTLIHITLLAYKAQPDAIGLIRNTFHGEMELQAVTLMMLKLAI